MWGREILLTCLTWQPIRSFSLVYWPHEELISFHGGVGLHNQSLREPITKDVFKGSIRDSLVRTSPPNNTDMHRSIFQLANQPHSVTISLKISWQIFAHPHQNSQDHPPTIPPQSINATHHARILRLPPLRRRRLDPPVHHHFLHSLQRPHVPYCDKQLHELWRVGRRLQTQMTASMDSLPRGSIVGYATAQEQRKCRLTRLAATLVRSRIAIGRKVFGRDFGGELEKGEWR